MRYLKIFFKEKDLPLQDWELVDNDGVTHWISNEVVIEYIHAAPRHEQTGIANMIRKIDFMNGDVNHFLRHLAGALINKVPA
jgi:hypothetical protein